MRTVHAQGTRARYTRTLACTGVHSGPNIRNEIELQIGVVLEFRVCKVALYAAVPGATEGPAMDEHLAGRRVQSVECMGDWEGISEAQ
jgi:hypothetical protein